MESVGIRDLLNWSKYIGRVSLYISLQAFGEQVLTPFNFNTNAGGNTAIINDLANRFANAVNAANPARNYQVGIGGSLRGIQHGTSTDYAIGGRGIPKALTILLPRGGASGYEVAAIDIQSIAGETFIGLEQIALHFA